MNLPLLLARRFLVRQKGVFAGFIIRLAIIATGLSVAVMILALAFITGFKHTIQSKLYSFWGEILIVPSGADQSSVTPNGSVHFDGRLVREARATKGVIQVAPFILHPVILQANNEMEGIHMKGVAKEFRFNKEIEFSGDKIGYTDSGYSQDIILSQSIANRLELKTGDSLRLYYLEQGESLPRARKLRVAGIFHTGMEEVDKQFAICDIRLLQRLAGWQEDEISGYQIDADQKEIAALAKDIDSRYVTRPMRAMPVFDVYQGLFSWLNMQDVTAIILLTIVSIVAIINLSAALIILLADRAVMIAMLKTLGIAPHKLQRTFMLLGAMIGGCGILLGNIIAIGIGWAQHRYGFITLNEETYYMHTAQAEFVPWHMLLVDAGTLILCFLCMWVPSLYIRSIRPAKVLQFE